MTWPRVSIVWVHYNSRPVLKVIFASLKAIANLRYPNFELIVVDNGSTDGSWEKVLHFIEAEIKPKVELKIIRLKRNWGFAGGNNAGYIMRDPLSKYTVLVNADAIPLHDMLLKYTHFMESNPEVGAAQGIIVSLRNPEIVDSAGGFIDPLFNIYTPFQRKPVDIVLRLFKDKPYINLSFVEGTMPIYRVEAVERAMCMNNRIFITAGFSYYLEDLFLSLRLWLIGYKCVLLPEVVGYHYRGAVIRHVSKHERFWYYAYRNRLALTFLVKDMYSKVVVLLRLLRCLGKAVLRKASIRECYSALLEAYSLSRQIESMFGPLKLKEVPLVSRMLKLKTVLCALSP